MKIYVTVILCILSACSVSFSQDREPIFRAIYQMEEIRDSVNSKYSEDIIHLELFPNHSFCYSQYTWFMDSLNMQPNSDKIWDEMFMAAFKKEGAGTRSFPHRRNTFEVVKKHTQKEMTVYDVIDTQYYTYVDSISDLEWNITDSIAEINQYTCNLATCLYHGRKWNAWFCPNLPWADGPWKLCGLPGLIIQAYDTEKLYKFELIGIKEISSEQVVKPWAKGSKTTTRKKFLENRYKYLKNLDNNFNAEFGITPNTPKNRSKRYRIGLENDYKR